MLRRLFIRCLNILPLGEAWWGFLRAWRGSVSVLLVLPLLSFVPDSTLQSVYDAVRTPYKYGLVVAPEDNGHKIDCPMVYRQGGEWFMTYVVYNGSDGLNGRGYETWLAKSDDLLHWTKLGRILSYADKGWDMNQRAGYPSLIDWDWNGSYEMREFRGRHWMSYFGGHGTGYEAVREPLSIGMASTKGDITIAHEWKTSKHPVLAYNDKDAQWWERLTQYKSTVYYDEQKALGYPFVMFYNAGGVNPKNNLKAERIGIALSDDMRHWHRYAGNPVFSHEQPGVITGDAQIVRFRGGSDPLYVMFYFSAYNPQRKYNAYNTFAVSRDLTHWQEWTGADLIYPSKTYDNMFAHKSYVVKHDGVVYHFYCAVNKDGQRGIAVATSRRMGQSNVHFPLPPKKGKRDVIDLDRGWLARVVKANQKLVYDEDEWHTVNIPHNFDNYYGVRQLRHGNLHGTAEYRKTFHLEKKDGKRYFIQFEGIGTYATVTINGHQFNRQGVGRTTLTLDVTPYLKANNEIDVKVEHPEMITDMPWVCGGCSAEWGFSEGSQPFGIFRPVSLVETDEVRVEPFGVHVWSNAACDSTFIETEIHNYGTADARIEFISKMNQADGKTFFRLPVDTIVSAGATITVRQAIANATPHRWNLDDPYLYTLASLIKRDGKTTDDTSTEFGYRSISWPARRSKDDHHGQFLLNGKPVFINGTCDYEHLLGNSHAWSHEQVASRVKMMRKAGFNAFREAHQPHNLYYQKLMDEQGMLFWSQFSAHIWYDTPQFRENFKRYMRQWIRERRNSPSIILWGLQNESVMPKDFTEECTRIIHDMDPTCRDQRMVTTCNGGSGSDWNVVQNWSGTYGGSADNYDKELKHDDQLLNGEYGAWRTIGAYPDTTKGMEMKYSEEAAARLLKKKAMLAWSARDSVCGHFQWIFVSHENPGRVQPDEALRRIDKIGPYNYKGLLSPWEQPTKAYYMYRGLMQNYDKVIQNSKFKIQNYDKVIQNSKFKIQNYDYHADSNSDGVGGYIGVNCGGDRYVSHSGTTFLADDSTFSHSWSEAFGLNPYMASQGHITEDIKGTDDDELYQFFRYGRDKLYFELKAPVDTVYTIELYFVEPWLGKGVDNDAEGERIFSVAVNDSIVIHDLDIYAEAGYATALKKVVTARPKDGKLRISFPEIKAGEAVISDIKISPSYPNHPKGSEKDNTSAPESSTKVTSYSPPLEGLGEASFWHSLDLDTIARYPKSLLPKDVEAFPAVRYKPTVEKRRNSFVWTIMPGVAREYSLRYRYKNTTGKAITARMTITDSHGIVLQDRQMTFPVTPKKFKTISTTTGTQINAGTYKVRITTKEKIDFQYLEVQ